MGHSKNRRSIRMGRRKLLAGLGAAAASLPFLRSFPASADGTPVPKLLIFASPNGFLTGPTGSSRFGYEGWLPPSLHDGNAYAEAPIGSRLPGILAPLERHRSELVCFHGLRGIESVNSHQQAASILTGRGVYADEPPRASGGDGEWYSQGQSVDQYIAERLGSRVLGLAYDISGFNLGEGYISHLGPNRGFTPIQNPVEAFERVFGAAAAGDVTRANTHVRRQSILDVIARDTSSIASRLPVADRPRFEQHLAAVRSLESELLAPTTCGDAGTAPGSYDARSSTNLPRLIRDYGRIMTQGFACGYTQVGFIQCGNLGGSLTPRWPELDVVSDYKDHAIAHKFGNEPGAGSDGLAQADAIRLGLNLQLAYNSLLAEILDQLAATPDVDGSRLLDNTIVLHVKQFGMNHDKRQLFWIMAGGSGLGVRTGRFVRLRLDSPYTFYNDLHVSLCHAMGLADVETFGEAELCRTPIDLS